MYVYMTLTSFKCQVRQRKFVVYQQLSRSWADPAQGVSFRSTEDTPRLAGKCNSGYKCVHVSDPDAKRWLADDPNFLASLNDLDRGLSGGGRRAADLESEVALPPDVAPPSPPPPPRPPASGPAPPVAQSAAPVRSAAAPGTAAARAARPINAARALDPSRLLDTAPTPQPIRRRAPQPQAAPPFAPPPPSDTIAVPPPPLAFTRPVPAETRARRPLLDLFPPSALAPEGPPLPGRGTAVGPQLPPRGRPAIAAAPAPAAGATSRLDGLSYETFYGLREKPFSLSTDPRFYYHSAAHERAAGELLAAIGARGGPAVLTGRVGAGKTALCRAIVLEIDRRTITSVVLEPIQSLDELLKTMLVDFGVLSRDDIAGAARLTRDVMTRTLGSFLDSLVPLQVSAAVFIDEAQNVPVSVLRELHDLLTQGGPSARVIQLVLVGQPSLTALLKQSELKGLNATVARRAELGRLALDEIPAYVTHRLSIAGGDTRVEFDDSAIARLAELSEGLPRSVNLLCDRALTRGHTASAAVITAGMIEEAAADLDLDPAEQEGRGPLGTVALVALFLVLVFVGAAAALYVSRDAVSRTVLQWENVPQPPGGPIRRLPVPIAPIPAPADKP